LARCAAFVEFMKKRGLAIPRDYVTTVSNDSAGGVRAMSTLLELSSPPTAVMAGTDNLAMGCIQAAWSLGCGVPANVSVTGFDGLPMSSYLWPSLVTMRQEVEEIAYQGLRLLARAKAGEAIPAKLIPVPPKFVAGASVRSLFESAGLQTDR
jgi:LacI family transcriptional regulator